MIYHVPGDGNCAYSAVVIGLMYHVYISDTRSPDSWRPWLSSIIEIKDSFSSLDPLDVYKRFEQQVIPALRAEIADFVDNVDAADPDPLAQAHQVLIDAAFDFSRNSWYASEDLTSSDPRDLSLRRDDARNPYRDRKDYLSKLREQDYHYHETSGGHEEGGLIEFVILELICGIRITAASFHGNFNQQRNANDRILDIRQAPAPDGGDARHYELHINDTAFCPPSLQKLSETICQGWEKRKNETKTVDQSDQQLKKLSSIVFPKSVSESGRRLSYIQGKLESGDIDTIESVSAYPTEGRMSYSLFKANSEKKRQLEQEFADEIKKTLKKSSTNLSVPEVWLVVQTIVACKYQDKLFYRAIRLLEKDLRRSKKDILSQLSALLNFANLSSKTVIKGLSFEEKILRQHIERLAILLDYPLRKNDYHVNGNTNSSNINSSMRSSTYASPLSSSIFSSPLTTGLTILSPSSPSVTISSADVTRNLLSDEISEQSIMDNPGFYLAIFDENFSNLSNDQDALRSKLVDMFEKVFNRFFSLPRKKNMVSLFSSENPHSVYQQSIEIQKALKPKSGLAPYAFALYCYYLVKQRTTPFDHEQVFIEQHIAGLQTFEYELELIIIPKDNVNLSAALLRKNMSLDGRCYVIDFIYPALNIKIEKLEADKNSMSADALREALRPYKKMRSFSDMISPSKNNKMIIERIRMLFEYAENADSTQKATPRKLF